VKLLLIGLALAQLVSPLLAAGESSEAAAPAGFSWSRTDTSLALRHNDRSVWRLVFDPAKPKSWFHPLSTVDGEVLTAFEPADHPWHRGLWWSWKLINGINYWEEDWRAFATPQSL